jgi:hypothetical protein
MNIQQINKSGHSIELFVYTSVALLLLSATGFYLRHVTMSALRLLRKLAISAMKGICKAILFLFIVIELMLSINVLGPIIRRFESTEMASRISRLWLDDA